MKTELEELERTLRGKPTPTNLTREALEAILDPVAEIMKAQLAQRDVRIAELEAKVAKLERGK